MQYRNILHMKQFNLSYDFVSLFIKWYFSRKNVYQQTFCQFYFTIFIQMRIACEIFLLADTSCVPIHENVNPLWYTFLNLCQTIPIYHVATATTFFGRHLWNYSSRRSRYINWIGKNPYLLGSFSTANYAKRMRKNENNVAIVEMKQGKLFAMYCLRIYIARVPNQYEQIF